MMATFAAASAVRATEKLRLADAGANITEAPVAKVAKIKVPIIVLALSLNFKSASSSVQPTDNQ